MGGRSRSDVEQIACEISALGLALTRAAAAVARDPGGLREREILLLLSLHSGGPMRPGAVGELTRLSSGGVTKMVERLEAIGLVERRIGVLEEDRRGVLVELTRRGRSTVRAMAGSIDRELSRQQQRLDDLSGLLSG